MNSTEAAVLAPVLAIVPTVFATVASTANASSHDRGGPGHSGRPRNRPPAKHTGSPNSTST